MRNMFNMRANEAPSKGVLPKALPKRQAAAPLRGMGR